MKFAILECAAAALAITLIIPVSLSIADQAVPKEGPGLNVPSHLETGEERAVQHIRRLEQADRSFLENAHAEAAKGLREVAAFIRDENANAASDGKVLLNRSVAELNQIATSLDHDKETSEKELKETVARVENCPVRARSTGLRSEFKIGLLSIGA